jgi:hypothetical protein
VSRPIENIQELINGGELEQQNIAMQYEYSKSAAGMGTSSVMMSEEARKKMRVDRLKRQTIGKEIMDGTAVRINNPQASDWDKMATLRQLEVLRETKK